MSRLGSDNQREHEHAERSPDSVATPIDVRVPEGGPGVRGASVDGALVVAAPGEEIQNAVLNRLHRLALAAGHPVLATIHDRRVGYSVPLRVDPDGSSHLAADPVPTGPVPADPLPTGPLPTDPTPEEPEEAPVRQDRRTRILRSVAPVADSAPTFTLRALPEPAGGTPPGTVAPPTGVFGPPPRMDGAATTGAPEEAEPLPVPGPVAVTRPPAGPKPPADSAPAPAPVSTAAAPAPDLGPRPDPYYDPDPKPTPARGFDAVAEAVLGDAPLTAPGDATSPALLAEPTARINEAVKEGRTEAAARLAERTVTEASATLGPEHPEVLRLRELTAYIAYLSGDPDRAFELSLELARIHRRSGDAEAAYGNVQSAATAWRGVRDPARGLELGHDLVGLWGELAAEDGPAAEDPEELESARTRMGRLTERARAGAQVG
ncbi:tetratricopeptide repeat protein [Streptomyces sp. PU10]|uniref:tetratricopeptide repeat protein n=1 Tax=Streptomyces TaxID=1883 RepID=UPI0013E09A77|nr:MULTISPECIES: tetratricopeptide repeat protein [Streptomyces]MDU0255553.1 tetratricopeptide repeat protein [Streptomyces sp. PU10]QKW61759.1 tetratricopeptide repeat protein [Streptomyces sp. NA03103]